MTVRTYDPNSVTVVLCGVPISGYADGSFVTVERNEDAFSLTIGADGEGCRAKTNNRSGRITVTLGQWSASNPLLSAIANLDELSPSGEGIAPSLIKDNSGTTIFSAENSWIVKQPSSAFAREPESREWVCETDDLAMFVGMNLKAN